MKINTTPQPEPISASEIGEYIYCPVGWYLHRTGHAPKSPYLKSGEELHKDLGVDIQKVQSKEGWSKTLKYIGTVLLVVAILYMLFGWLL